MPDYKHDLHAVHKKPDEKPKVLHIDIETKSSAEISKSGVRRYVEDKQPIKGNFFICGLGEEDFAELPEDLIRKYTERFWVPEAFVSMFGQMSIIRMDDGTKPE